MSKPISGYWEFNDTITMDGWASYADATKEYVNFTTYKSDSDPSHIYIGFNLQHYNEYDNLQYLTSTTSADRSYVWAKPSTSTYDLGWQYEQRKIVNFGKTVQYVTDAFYEWFTANATKIFIKTFTKLNLADIVATSGGKSFRKLSAEEPIVGTWKFNSTLSDYPETINGQDIVIPVTFTSDYSSNTRLSVGMWNVTGSSYGPSMYYADETYGGGAYLAYKFNTDKWVDTGFRTIHITEAPTDETFISWLKANATKVS